MADSCTADSHPPDGDSRFININMIPAKLTYFLSEAYMGCILPFFNIFCVSMGLTAAQAGLITGVGYAAASIASPLWACLIDYTGHRKLVFVIMWVGTVGAVSATPWMAYAVATYNVTSSCVREMVGSNGTTNSTAECLPDSFLTNSNTLFLTLLLVSTFSRVFYVTLPNYIDALVMTKVKTEPVKTSFGAQRLFGSLGFGSANFLVGLVIDHYKPTFITQYISAFYVFLLFALPLLPCGYILIRQLPPGSAKNKNSANFSSHMKSYLIQPDTIVFLLTVTISGMALNVYLNFLFLLMNDFMNSSKTVMTLTIVMSVLSELIGFPFSSKIITLLGGPIPTIITGVFSYAPRFMLMSFISNPWLALPVQLLHIFGLALSWAAQIDHAYSCAPKEITMTAISIIASIHFVASSACANILGGIAYHAYGGRVLFRVCGVVCAVWSVLITFYYYGVKRCRRKVVVVVDSIDKQHYGSYDNKSCQKDIEQG